MIMCGSCPWCVSVPLAVRRSEYLVNLEDDEVPTEEGLRAWVVDAYPLCPDPDGKPRD